ncbi:programmed cell death 1 ligand 1-like isoform X4 [Boleophthalmus pectinirostris]|uniref:programmed cell death 1 ligand 1-like isoform X4 n=1 Tax=Boleophthalmus pectinirostris TaxID=150288 RepID=UPI002430305B|nr:programmed cell death 1 ligand 1-like isoform X4 [Boleophthalmus pectinirostris]XP_055016644.1 programmed cell death 1 ligand 1-like isoform X4 [Boleophthalmus pectinirostris]
MTLMILLPLLCLLSPGFGPASAQDTKPNNMVTVSEGDDALLPCALSSGQNIEQFDWRNDNGEEEKMEVFMYDRGLYYGHGIRGQSEQFVGRVEFFKDELKSGNASIKIKNTRLEDSGTYTCWIMNPVRSVVNIILHVVVLKIGENVPGAAQVPYIETVHDEVTWRQLKCKAEGVPEPEVEWRNSDGDVLANHVPQNQNGRSHVELQLNVTRSDNYTCVVTQSRASTIRSIIQ